MTSPCPIIDFRVRPPTADVMKMFSTPVWSGMSEWLKPDLTEVPLPDYVDELRSHGVWRAVFPGRDIESTFGFRITNDHVADVCRSFPDFFVGAAGIDPHKGRAAIREIDRAASLGLRGVSIDPYFHKLPADHRLYYPIYAKAAELGMFVMITTGPAARIGAVLVNHGHPQQIDTIALHFPELTFIVSHGGYPWPAEMVTVANKQPGVFFECSAYERMPHSDVYVAAANEVAPDKVLFGGLAPFTPTQTTLAIYAKLGFSDEAWQRVMFSNGAALLQRHGVLGAAEIAKAQAP